MAVPRIEVSGLPAGTGLATTLAELATTAEPISARLRRRDGRSPEITIASGLGRSVIRFPARLGGRLALRPAREPGLVRARLELGVRVEARVRAPGRRHPGEIPAGELAARSRGELALEADLPGTWSLRKGLAHLARLVRPGRWIDGPAPPAGTRWSIVHESVLGLGASAVLREALVRVVGAGAAVARVPAGIELATRFETLARTRVTLAATARGTVRGSLAILGRHSERLAARSTLGLRVGDPDRLARTALDGVLGAAAGLYERLADLELRLAELHRRLARLEDRVRAPGLRIAGPGSTLERIERTLAGALDILDITTDAPGDLREDLARALALVRAARREIGALAEETVAALRRVLQEARLDRLVRKLGRLLTWLELRGDELAWTAGDVLAAGISAELSATVSRAREGSDLVRVEMEPGRAGTRRAIAALLAGRLVDLAGLAPGEAGIVTVEGRAVRTIRARRSLALRLRVAGRVFATRRSLERILRVDAAWDGALAVDAGTALSRRREGIEGLAGLVLDLAATGKPGRVDPVFVLSWRERWPESPRGRSRAVRRSPGLAAVAAATGDPPLVPPPDATGLLLRARLLPGDVRAMLRLDLSARRFAAEAFWPAWLAALESAASRSSRDVLDGAGRHPLRDSSLRRKLARDPSGASLRDRFPRDVARETVAADHRVGRAVLAAIEEVRRAARRRTRNLASLREAVDELARSLGHHRTIDPVPLLFLLYLVPERRRRLQLEWREPPPPPRGEIPPAFPALPDPPPWE